MIVVMDTNIFISGIFWEGNEEKILDLCMDGEITNYTSPDILEELDRVLHYNKFSLDKLEIERILHIYISISKIIVPQRIPDIMTEDPTDNKFIECAISSNADYLLTGDKHLLEIRDDLDIKILKAVEFLKLIE
ncbi:MAG: putative toxin-antitoxin system toxin component, PIN family [Thermoplasmatota archaeon]